MPARMRTGLSSMVVVAVVALACGQDRPVTERNMSAGPLQTFSSAATFGVPPAVKGGGVIFDVHQDTGQSDPTTPAVSTLAIDGVGQAVGVGLLVWGLSSPRTVLLRNDLAGVEVHAMPLLTGKSAGFGLGGMF